VNLAWDEFGGKLQAYYKDNILNVERIEIKGTNSKIVADGKVNLENKKTNLEGGGYFELDKAEKIMNFLGWSDTNLLKNINPAGLLNIKFIIENESYPLNLKLKLAGFGEKVKIRGVNLNDMRLEIYGDKNELILSPLLASIGRGKIDLRIKVNFLKGDSLVNFNAQNIELSLLKEAFPWRNRQLTGNLWLEAFLENKNLFSPKSWEGEGEIVIKEGNLWEISLLKGLGKFLLIPEFEKITFKDGYTEFAIQDEHIIFDKVELNSLQMGLEGKGNISFSGKLNFLFFPRFNPSLLSASEGLKKIITQFLGKTGLIVEIKGTTKNPSYKIKPAISSTLKSLGDILKGILK
jgi:hypothetical protein